MNCFLKISGSYWAWDWACEVVMKKRTLQAEETEWEGTDTWADLGTGKEAIVPAGEGLGVTS